MKQAFIVLCLALGIVLGLYIQLVMTQNEEMVTAELVEEHIRNNPQIIWDILETNPEKIFSFAIDGQNIKRQKAIRAEREAQLENPVKATVDESRPILGAKDAPITIVEFSDFQCPHCSNASQALKKVVEQYAGKVRVQFKHFPLRSHDKAPIAAQYYEAVGLQNKEKAWEFHDLLFTSQKKLYERGEEWLKEAAASLGGLDMEKLVADANSEAMVKRVQADRAEAESLDIGGTPTFIVNGVLIAGGVPPKEFAEVIDMVDAHMKKNKNAATAPLKDAAQ